jgi:TatD DNase family protein
MVHATRIYIYISHLTFPSGFYATVGCHPTRSAEPLKQAEGVYMRSIEKLITDNLSGPGRAVAVGECGLDYDRLHFADKETQKKAFRRVFVQPV